MNVNRPSGNGEGFRSVYRQPYGQFPLTLSGGFNVGLPAALHSRGSLLDYAVPRARDVPAVEMRHLEIPSPFNPLGVKGLGEGGAVGAHAAIANAVADALRTAGAPVRATPLSSLAVARLLGHAAPP